MATFTVTTLDDEAFDAGDLAAETADGAGLSLREALALVSDADTIEFDAALSGGVSNLSSTLLTSTSVTIDGDIDNDGRPDITLSGDVNGDDLTTTDAFGNTITNAVLNANNTDNVKVINIYGASPTVTIDGLVITGGGNSGLTVSSNVTGTIQNSSISGNFSANNGGGISTSGTLTVRDSIISTNNAAGDGGGIRNIGDMNLIRVLVSDNNSSSGGGGVFNLTDLIIANSTILRNNAAEDGGGIRNDGYLTAVNTTLAGNYAGELGGGVYSRTSQTVSFSSSTITGNIGGGIHSAGTNATHVLYITNSIVAGNYSSGGAVDDLAGLNTAFTELDLAGVSILGNAPAGFLDGVSNDSDDIILGVGNSYGLSDVFSDIDPVTGGGQLSDNGGPLETIALSLDGVAINAGDASALPTDVQDLDGDANSGEPLPIDGRGFDRVTGDGLDIGALEMAQTFTVTTLDDEAFDSGDITAETNDGAGLSLREALALVSDGDTIEFDALLSGGTLTLTLGQLTLAQGIHINGDINADDVADITLDADGSGRVIHFTTGGTSSLNGLIITGANYSGGGGAVTVDYDAGISLTISNSEITSNIAEVGGGIWNGGDLTILNTLISGNQATTGDGGGVFNWIYSSITITNSAVYGNSAASSGGGVYVGAFGSAEIESTEFSGNSSEYGGGLYVGLAVAAVRDSYFGENTALEGGGAIFSAGTIYVANSLFSANTAVNGRGYGGAIWTTRIAEIVNSTFVGNSALYGGAIYQRPVNLSLEIDNSTITGNYATNSGGGIVFGGSGAYGRITNSIVSGNDSGGSGADIRAPHGFTNTGGNIIGTDVFFGGVDVGDTTLADVFRDVGANPDTGVTSGLLAVNDGPLLTVALNIFGDAVDAGDSTELPVDAHDLDNDANTAEDLPVDARGLPRVSGAELDLGAVEMSQTFTVTTLDDETFDAGDLAAETADGNGLSLREALALAQDGDTIEFDGALSGGTLTLSNGQLVITQDDFLLDGDIDNNGTADITIDANGASRVIQINGGDEADPNDVTIDGLVITGGQLSGSDGAGVRINTDATVTIQNSYIYGNNISSEGGGGGISVGSISTLNLIDSIVSNNSAALYGGGIVTVANSATINISNSDITHNEAVNGGGGIYSRGTTTISEGSTIYMNEAFNGGGIMSGGNLTVDSGSVIANNTAGNIGGGVFVEGTATISYSAISGNSAGIGGGIFNQSGDLTARNTYFTGNYAGGYGGALFTNNASSSTIINSQFNDNTTDSGAGAIYAYGSNALDPTSLNVLNSTFRGSEASGNGGAVGIQGVTNAVFTNATFYDNQASGHGAALHVGGDANVGIYNSTFTGNTTNNTGGGGGVFAQDDSTVTIGNTIIAGNEGSEGRETIYAAGNAAIISTSGNVFDQIGVGGEGDIFESELDNIFDEVVALGPQLFAGVLDDNGGPVPTVALNPIGIAVDAGDNTNLPQDDFDLDEDMNTGEDLPFDARGEDRIQNGTVDSGAYEAAPTTTLTVTTAASGSGEDAYSGGDLAAEMGDGNGLSLAEALALAQSGDTIEFDAAISGAAIFTGGEYGDFTASQDNLTIDGDIDNDGIADITIELVTGDIALTLSGGSDLDAQDVTIDGVDFASSNTGRGVVAGAYTNLTLSNSELSDFEDSAIQLGYGSTGTITNAEFISNYGEHGGAIRTEESVNLTVANSYFYGNAANQGGAIFAYEGASVSIEGSDFVNNYSSGSGGAVYMASSGTTLTVTNSTFTGNETIFDGGAIFQENGESASISGSTFYENSSLGGRGGAVYIGGTDAEIVFSTFEQNSAYSNGGGISNNGTLNVLHSTFENNEAGQLGGGVHNAGTLTLFNSTFSGNSAYNGGAVENSGEAALTNATILGNTSYGGGAGLANSGDMAVASSTITGNLSTNGAYAGINNIGTLSLANSIVTANEGILGPYDVRGASALYGGNIIGTNIYDGAADVGDTSLGQIFQELAVDGNTGILTGRLRDNGGPVLTAMINPSGPAFGGGNAAALPLDTLDLDGDMDTGEALPVDGRGDDRIANGTLDIGAVELQITDGTNGADMLTGDEFSEIINALGSGDTVMGGGGRDTLNGGGAADVIFGGDGGDYIIGDLGADEISGDEGDDFIDGGNGFDTLTGGSGDDMMLGGIGDDRMLGNDGNDTIDGGNRHDFLAGQDGDDSLLGGAGDDEITGGNGNDTIAAGGGDDTAGGGGGDDVMLGEAGDDLLNGGEGLDTIDGGNGNDRLAGAAGDDFVSGGAGNDVVKGNDGNDTLQGGNLNDTLNGGAGNDMLDGGNNDDRLTGANGDDTLIGGSGNDTLLGNTGNDLFIFNVGDGVDIVSDFTAGMATDDVIELSGFGAGLDEFSEVIAAASDDGTDTTIDLGGGQTLTLLGVVVADLHSDDFIFS